MIRGKVVDLTRTIEGGMEVYPGDPEVEVNTWTTMEENGYRMNVIRMGEHTGTHVDAPAHIVEDGTTIDKMPIEAFLGTGVVVDTGGRDEEVGASEVPEGLQGMVVLFSGGRELGIEAAKKLVRERVKAVGVECASVGDLEVHRILLGAGVPVYENLTNVEELRGKDFIFLGLPLKIVNGSGSPVRAVAILTDSKPRDKASASTTQALHESQELRP